jgi:DNA-directed RNA polymerase specialized sigma24 family protein
VVKEASMDSADRGTKRIATADDIRAAIEALTVEDLSRLRHVVSAYLYGSEYTDPLELVNEALVRALRGAGDDEGRHWPLDISFVQFLVGAAKSIASDSRGSPAQARTDYHDDLVPEGMAATDFAVEPLRAPSAERSCEDDEELAAALAKSAETLASIETFFADAEEVLMLVLCLREGMRPREIQAVAGMTLTQYNSARTRLRRGLMKLGLREKRP